MPNSEPRPYDMLRKIVEQEGGRMIHERAGRPQGGSWVVTLHEQTTVFESNGAGYPKLDNLYVPNVKNPQHYSDYSCDLIDGARDEFLCMLK